MAKSIDEQSKSARFVRQFQFDQETYEQFEALAGTRAVTPGALFRKVVTDFLAGKYVNLDRLPPATIAALERRSRSLVGVVDLQLALESILNKWAEDEPK